MAERDYTAQNESLLNEERRKFEKKKATAEALQENMNKKLAAVLKSQTGKEVYLKEALEASRKEHAKAVKEMTKEEDRLAKGNADMRKIQEDLVSMAMRFEE